MTDSRRDFLIKFGALSAMPLLPSFPVTMDDKPPNPPCGPYEIILRPEDFGAVGDGKHDDSGAWMELSAFAIEMRELFPSAALTVIYAPTATYTFHRNMCVEELDICFRCVD